MLWAWIKIALFKKLKIILGNRIEKKRKIRKKQRSLQAPLKKPKQGSNFILNLKIIFRKNYNLAPI